MRARVIALLVLVVLAGCAGLDVPDVTDTPTDAATPLPAADVPPTTPAPVTTTTTRTATAAATTATATRTPTPTPPPSPAGLPNPWGHDPVVIGVNDTVGGAAATHDAFRAAIEYWRAHDHVYADVNVPFAFEPDAADPDIELRYVDRIDRCGETEAVSDPLGCAPYYEDQRPRPHTVIYVRENEDDDQLTETVKHELGHVLGIGHGEPPMPLMAENNLYLLASPWDAANVTYAVDYDDKPGYAEAEYDEEIRVALEYLAGGADGTLDPAPGFHRVEDRGDANIVIEFHDDPLASTGDPGSRAEGIYQGEIQGTPYRRFTVAIYELDPAVTAYHVAYWYAQVVIGEDDPAYPDVLRPGNCDYDCRHGEWHR